MILEEALAVETSKGIKESDVANGVPLDAEGIQKETIDSERINDASDTNQQPSSGENLTSSQVDNQDERHSQSNVIDNRIEERHKSIPDAAQQKSTTDLVQQKSLSDLIRQKSTASIAVAYAVDPEAQFVTAIGVMEEDFEHAQQLEQDKKNYLNKAWKESSSYCVPLLVTLFIVIIVVAIAVPLATRKAPHEPVGRESEIFSKLEAVSGRKVHDLNTPQGMAADWIVSKDMRQLAQNNIHLMQRYSLAVLYFSTNGSQWTYCSQNPSESSCEYSCWIDNQPQNCTSMCYLSESHECSWMGNSCIEDEGDIRNIALRKYSKTQLKHV